MADEILFIIEINDFKNIHNGIYTFHRGITLLKGSSGVGKTTIFSAIVWCLYGKIDYVTPFRLKNSKTCNTYVRFVTDGLTITRSNGSKSLTLKFSDTNDELKDEDAQACINSIFGSEQKFYILSYTEQKGYTRFFDLKDTEKLNFLNMLSVDEESVNSFKCKIQSKIEELKNEYKSYEAVYLHELRRLEDMNVKKQVNEQIDEQEIISLTNELNSLKLSMEANQKRIIQEASDEKTIIRLTDDINDKKKELDRCIVLSEDELTDCIQKFNELQNVKNKMKEERMLRESIKLRTTELNSLKLPQIDRQEKFTNDEINDVVYIEMKHKTNLSICKKLNIHELSEESLNSLKDELRKRIDFKIRREFYDKYITLKMMIESRKNELNSIIINNSIESLDMEKQRISEEIDELKLLLNPLYSCPKCNENLIIHDHQLISVNVTVNDQSEIKNQIKKRNIELKRIEDEKRRVEASTKRIESLQKEIKNNQSIMNVMYPTVPDIVDDEDDDSLNSLKIRLSEVDKIELVDVPQVTSIMMQSFNKSIDLENELSLLKIRLDSLFTDEERDLINSVHEIEYYRSMIDNNRINKNRSEFIIKDLIGLRRKLNGIHFNKEEYQQLVIHQDEMKNRSNFIEDTLKEMEEKLKIQKINETINTNEEKMRRCNDDINCLNELKKKVITLECIHLENTIKMINQNLNYSLKRIFVKQDITVNITLMKKKDGRAHASVDIVKDGNKYPNISCLSGGEVDRLSLALTLSLNHMHNWIFVIFDEIFASLDCGLREMCIKLINELMINAIIISHEEIEGYYNHVISIDE